MPDAVDAAARLSMGRRAFPLPLLPARQGRSLGGAGGKVWTRDNGWRAHPRFHEPLSMEPKESSMEAPEIRPQMRGVLSRSVARWAARSAALDGWLHRDRRRKE